MPPMPSIFPFIDVLAAAAMILAKKKGSFTAWR